MDGWGNGTDVAYYFVDDIKLTLCSALTLAELSSLAIGVNQNQTSSQLILTAPVETHWTVYDVSGRVLDELHSDSESSLLDVSGFARGLYLVNWSYRGRTGTEKVFLDR